MWRLFICTEIYNFSSLSQRLDVELVDSKKLLYCASTTGHLKNFHLPYIQALHEAGYQVVVCADKQEPIAEADYFFCVPFQKSITSLENVKNIFRLYRFLRKEQFTAIGVHTTLAAAVVRAAVRLLPQKQRPKVFYTCHGYLFDDADGWRKWKYLLPEKICAAVTDVLLVMNQRDRQLAEQYQLFRGNLVSIPGMGVDFSRFDLPQTKQELRQQYGISVETVLFVFAGEFSARKNQQQLINAFAKVARQMPSAKLVLAGEGAMWDICKEQARQLQVENRVLFPGQVKNMAVLYHCCDVCVSASRIEGLPFNIMEAMYCGLPCIASRVKGHEDLLQHNYNGMLFETEQQLAGLMVQLYRSEKLRQQLGQQAKKDVEQYGLEKVFPVVMQVYEENV